MDITETFKKLDDITPDDTALLWQVFIRLCSEGIICDHYNYGDLLDAVLGRGEYDYPNNREVDNLTYEDLV